MSNISLTTINVPSIATIDRLAENPKSSRVAAEVPIPAQSAPTTLVFPLSLVSLCLCVISLALEVFFLPIPQCNLFCLHPSISPAFSLTKYLIYDFVDIFGSILAKNVRVPFVGALRRLAIAEKSKL